MERSLLFGAQSFLWQPTGSACDVQSGVSAVKWSRRKAHPNGENGDVEYFSGRNNALGDVDCNSVLSGVGSVAVFVRAFARPSSPWLVAVLASSSHSKVGPVYVCPAAVTAAGWSILLSNAQSGCAVFGSSAWTTCQGSYWSQVVAQCGGSCLCGASLVQYPPND
jgi:hypothetical protein